MDNDGRFFVKILAWSTIVITLTIGSCCAHVDYRIAGAIKKGIDPVLARAAFSNSDGPYDRMMHMANENKYNHVPKDENER